MAGFLRKKSRNDAAKANAASNPQQNPSSPSAPLFARFSTTTNSANDTQHQRVVVSGPMSLSSGRKDSASVHSGRNAPPPVDIQRRKAGNGPPPSAFSYDSGNAGHSGYPQSGQNTRYSMDAQQPLAPVIRDKPLPPTDPSRRTSVRAPQAVYADSKPLPVTQPQNPNSNGLRSSMAGTNRSSYQPIMNQQPQPSSSPPNLGFDSQGRHSPLIDLPPEIALFQEFGDSLMSTPPGSLNSKSTGQQQHQYTSGIPPISPASGPPPISSPPIPANSPTQHIPPARYAPTPPGNNMGVNISTGHGHGDILSSSPLKDFRVSLRSSTITASNNSFPTNTPSSHNEKRTSFSPYPQPSSPPRRAPTSPPAPMARPPIAPKTPSKRQKALPQVPPQEVMNMPLSVSPPRANPMRSPPRAPASLQPSPNVLPRNAPNPSPSPIPGPHPTAVMGMTGQGPNNHRPRIFGAMEASNLNANGNLNVNRSPYQPPVHANGNGNGIVQNYNANNVNNHNNDGHHAATNIRISQIPEIPQEGEVQNAYPSPPTEYIKMSPSRPGTPGRKSSGQLQREAAVVDPTQSSRSPSMLTKSRPLSVVSGTSRASRTANTMTTTTTTTTVPPSSFSLPPMTSTTTMTTTSAAPGIKNNGSITIPSTSNTAATSLPSTIVPPLRTRTVPPSSSHTPPTQPQMRQSGSENTFAAHIPGYTHANVNETASGLTVPDVSSSGGNGDVPPPLLFLANGNENGSLDVNAATSGRPLTPMSPQPGKLEPAFEVNESSASASASGVVGVGQSEEALIGDDPFARVDGVKVVAKSDSPRSVMKEGRDRDNKEEKKEKEKGEKKDARKDEKERDKDRERRERRKEKERRKSKSKERSKESKEKKEGRGSTSAPQAQPASAEDRGAVANREGEDVVNAEDKDKDEPQTMDRPSTPLSSGGQDSHVDIASILMSPPPLVADMLARAAEREKHRVTKDGPFSLADFVSDPEYLKMFLEYLSFYDWCVLASVSRVIRVVMVQKREAREEILERYLRTVGYERWMWEGVEPLSLSLQDLSDYMRGVSTPTHEYARISGLYVQSLSIHPDSRDPSMLDTVRALMASTRAYTRVMLRLRAQAEKELAVYNANLKKNNISLNGYASPVRSAGPTSRTSSRAPSPTYSSFSHSHSQHHLPQPSSQQHSPQIPHAVPQQQGITFRSPLFRMRRAPLLRVFVPSPEGDWLSDKSVLECEAECRRAGVTNLLRMGDVVWDIAVGDEGNVGRLVWDGSYLIDLDYTYSPTGELPKYMPALAFPPSYFHRVIRPSPTSNNPIMHIDLSLWGEEIAANLQLLQDRVRTETPQGAYHNVVRWVHRSSFVIRPPSRHSSVRVTGGNNGKMPVMGRIPIPGADNLFVDPGWYGTIVVETEGTNESLADLQDRCGPGAFPPRVRGAHAPVTQAQVENRKVFRILREKSRPGEIWIKCVSVKERLL